MIVNGSFCGERVRGTINNMYLYKYKHPRLEAITSSSCTVKGINARCPE